MLRRRLLISLARASRKAGGTGHRVARLAVAGARALDRPDPTAPPDSTPLALLPATVLDCETTGLDPARDRVVSLAALRFAGSARTAHVTLDMLVDPGVPIPPRSTAIHGITDAMVASAPVFRDASRRLVPLLRGAVLVGHAIAFDRMVLARESRRAALPWRDPPVLCTRELAAALLPLHAGLELEDLARRFDIEIVGRHTALGDVLATARLFDILLRQAEAAGASSLGALRALAEDGRHRLARRRGSGG